MSRTKGSGWGGGVMLYQYCPHCGRKKVIYQPIYMTPSFKCTACKERFDSTDLLKVTFKAQLK